MNTLDCIKRERNDMKFSERLKAIDEASCTRNNMHDDARLYALLRIAQRQYVAALNRIIYANEDS